MVVLPSDGGSPVTKSTAICDQGPRGSRKRLRRLAGGLFDVFPWANTGQVTTKDLASCWMEGHQNHCCSKRRIWAKPRWPHWRTSERTNCGTNSRLWGLYAVPGSGNCARPFASINPQYRRKTGRDEIWAGGIFRELPGQGIGLHVPWAVSVG